MNHDTYPICLWSLLLLCMIFLPVMIVAGIAEGIVRVSKWLARIG